MLVMFFGFIYVNRDEKRGSKRSETMKKSGGRIVHPEVADSGPVLGAFGNFFRCDFFARIKFSPLAFQRWVVGYVSTSGSAPNNFSKTVAQNWARTGERDFGDFFGGSRHHLSTRFLAEMKINMLPTYHNFLGVRMQQKVGQTGPRSQRHSDRKLKQNFRD
ncbi:hypothetical protein U1Q18_052821 [Sarracenia purpurea var. burkii]